MIEASIKQTEPATVAYITMQGPYAQVPDALGRLYGWVGEHRLKPVGMPAAVYFTTPDTTPEDQAVWEVWAPLADQLPDSVPDASGTGVKRVDGATVASAIHKGPYDTVGETYGELMGWVMSNGYEIAGPPRELYLNDPNEVGTDEILTEIQFPVHAVS